MKTIPLTQGKVALVDDEDYDFLNKYSWHLDKDGYVYRRVKENKKCKRILMHRLILNILNKPDILSDHKNRDRTDNRRCNLRKCTREENNRNISSYGKCKYLGVCYSKSRYKNNTYITIKAQIRENGRNKYLGAFKTEEEAARVYDIHAKRIYGEFANLNFKE